MNPIGVYHRLPKEAGYGHGNGPPRLKVNDIEYVHLNLGKPENTLG